LLYRHLVEQVVGDDRAAPLPGRLGLADQLVSDDRPVLDELVELDAGTRRRAPSALDIERPSDCL
jgi:hypothetical protein